MILYLVGKLMLFVGLVIILIIGAVTQADRAADVAADLGDEVRKKRNRNK